MRTQLSFIIADTKEICKNDASFLITLSFWEMQGFKISFISFEKSKFNMKIKLQVGNFPHHLSGFLLHL
jgi:hypothetical protein